MRLKSLLNALEKAGAKIEFYEDIPNRKNYHATIGGKVAHWWSDDYSEIISLSVYRQKDKDNHDLYDDFYYGWFPKTIKSLIKYLKEE